MAAQSHDNMDNSMHEGEASTSNSPQPDGQTGPKAPKDKQCPFCAQPFTSSSLGRHLDLYIKPKNPKAPDGIHDVEKIKQMRGSITRRQPRSGQKSQPNTDGPAQWHGRSHRDSEGGSATGKTVEHSPATSPVPSAREHHGEGTSTNMYVNAPTWHATGVINNLPARAPSRGYSATPGSVHAQRPQEVHKDNNRSQRVDYGSEDVWKLQEAAELGRAAEMALREVLGSLEAAKKKAAPAKMFDEFDFTELSFAGLCLAMLPPPPTLFSTTPFGLAHTWPLSPPGEKQYTAMQRVMSERVASVRNGNPDNLPDSTIFRYQVHMQGAWEHWQLLSETEKASSWSLEMARAFVKERARKETLQSDLDQANQRIRHLEAEYDRLSRCQLPREYLLYQPRTMPVSDDTMREMRHTDTNPGGYQNDYDADALIYKWKSAIRATGRSSNKAPVPGQHNSTTTPTYISETHRNPLRSDMFMSGSVFGVNGPMPREKEPGRGLHGDPVRYETPERPGAIVGEGEEDGDGRRGAEQEYVQSGAVAGALMVREGVNGNGKRPYTGTPAGWGGREKVAREAGGRG